MKEFERLSIADAESAYDAICELIKSYQGYPDTFRADAETVRWNMAGKVNTIGLFPMSGAVYVKRYINGSYVAQMPFQIVYTVAVTTNKATITAQDMLSELARWLESCCIEFKDKNIGMESISRMTPVFIALQDEKATGFAINMQLRYRFKK